MGKHSRTVPEKEAEAVGLKNCLVTGVAGFIGSHLAERLIAEGHRVIGVDCFRDFYPRQIKESNLQNLRGHNCFALIDDDLLSFDLVALLRGEATVHRGLSGAPMDLVFHLAGQPGVRTSWGSTFETYVRDNILTTQKLLEAAKDGRLDKFVYASSSSVYGDAETLPTPEQVMPQPVSPYGVTKLTGEHLCQLYWRYYGIPVTMLRYFSVYGPRQRPDIVFHRFIRAIQKGETITVYGDGEQTRDFTFIGDIIDGTVRAALAPAPAATAPVATFNIGGGSQVALNHAIRTIEMLLGKHAQVRYAEPQHGDARHTSADIQRAAAAFDYSPRVGLEDGLKAEIEWLRILS